MKHPGKHNRGRLVLRGEQLRQLNSVQLARLHGGAGENIFSAGACTETCTACQQTTQTGPDSVTHH